MVNLYNTLSTKTKYRLFFNLIFMMGSLIVFSACEKELNDIDESQVMKKLSLQEEELINSTNKLSLDILRAEYKNNTNKSYFFSPVSVNMALGMIYNGVGEEEKLQILQATGLEMLAQNEINKSYNELLSFLQTSELHSNISYANSLWFSSDIDINEDYRTRVMAYYDAEIEELNFNKTSSFDFINSWGNMKTRGRFQKIIDQAPPKNTQIFLINAFGLSTSWNHSVNSFISQSPFYNNQGESEKIKTLNWDGIDVRVNENSDYSFIEFPFEDKTFNFSAVIPKDINTTGDLLDYFSIEELKSLSDNSNLMKTNLSMPEVSFFNERPMKSALCKIGLQKLFTTSTDLSPSFTQANKHIEDICQKSMVNLNSSYASADQLTSFSNLGLRQLTVDRPFIYFIRDKHTRTVLFAGYFANSAN